MQKHISRETVLKSLGFVCSAWLYAISFSLSLAEPLANWPLIAVRERQLEQA